MVNQVDTSTFDFVKLRNAFRTLDTDNSGTLELSELRTAFNELNMSEQEIDQIFERIDFNHDGEINYSEFLAATIDVQNFLTESRLKAVFN